jgi:hypothetical protein
MWLLRDDAAFTGSGTPRFNTRCMHPPDPSVRAVCALMPGRGLALVGSRSSGSGVVRLPTCQPSLPFVPVLVSTFLVSLPGFEGVESVDGRSPWRTSPYRRWMVCCFDPLGPAAPCYRHEYPCSRC